jgi:magnesium chelatase family protein
MFLSGGSKVPSPGEVSLSHEGVLFLDEFPEFRRSTLEVLRQPLEDGKVTITRATGTLTFPARFMLVAAMNPSPTSRPGEGGGGGMLSQKYRDRISGPLLDRIDVQIEVPALKKEDYFDRPIGESSTAIRERVSACRERQRRRFKEKPHIRCNSQMGAAEIRVHCALGEMTRKMMEQSLESLRLSARGFDRVLKVARTIADLADRPTLEEEDIFEAIQFRSLERNYWRSG